MIQLRKIISTCLIVCMLFIGFALSSNAATSAIAEPVTPEAAQYEIDHAKSPEAAGKQIQNQADDYKDELAEDTQYTKHAANNAAERSKGALKQGANTVKDKLNSAQNHTDSQRN